MPKKSPHQMRDPFAARESAKYDQPIVSREFLLDLIKQHKMPVSQKHVAATLNYTDSNRLEALHRRLTAMVRDGQIFQNRRGGYISFDHMDLEKGCVQAHADGFGFLIPESDGKDIFLAERQMRRLMHGDKAAVKITHFDTRRKRSEGALITVLERAHETVIGRYQRESGIDFMVPDDKRLPRDILINRDVGHTAKPGDIVVVRITKYPKQHTQAVGIIETVLGQADTPGIAVTIAINKYAIPHQWHKATLHETETLQQTIKANDLENRQDLRHLPFVTIDGADARDFDDAVYCEATNDGSYRLYVAIADVAHYVHPDSALDREAAHRGTSVYFPGEVIPMLPEVLSNDLCSLKPNVDRLCLVCCMTINLQGDIKNYTFSDAVIHSQARLIYDEVAAALDTENPAGLVTNQAVKQNLENLQQVYQALSKARKKRHALEFDTQEIAFNYNAQHQIESIVPIKRNIAHMIIEACMIAANVCAAKLLKQNKIPTLYRTHAGPHADKLPNLNEFLVSFGIKLPNLKPTPKDYAEMLEQARARPEFDMIQTVMIRSLLQANYSPDGKIGHFGLALQDYAHFTSPIRRYPDLLVHRAIKYWIKKGDRESYNYNLTTMTALGDSCSQHERRADEATRDVTDWLKCEFLQKRIGQQYNGIITGVTSFGLFVQIDDLLISGLVHVTSLPRDYYHFDPVHQRLIGELTNRCYQLGNRLTIKVIRVDKEARKIDFDLLETKRSHRSKS